MASAARHSPALRATQIASAEWASDDKVVRVTAEAIAATVNRLRGNIAKVGGDPVTEDLLIGISARLEQLHWMWEAKAA